MQLLCQGLQLANGSIDYCVIVAVWLCKVNVALNGTCASACSVHGRLPWHVPERMSWCIAFNSNQILTSSVLWAI